MKTLRTIKITTAGIIEQYIIRDYNGIGEATNVLLKLHLIENKIMVATNMRVARVRFGRSVNLTCIGR